MAGSAFQSSRLERLAAASFARPGRTLLAWAAVLAVSGFGLARLEVDTSTSSFLDRTGPAWATYQSSLERFGGDEFIVIALRSDAPWDRQLIARVVELSARLEDLPGVRRVDSVATVPLIRSDEFGVRTDSGLADGLPATEEDWRAWVLQLRSDRLASRSLVSADERGFAINVLLDSDIDADRAETVSRVEQMLDGLDASVSGVPVFRTAVNSQTRSELLLFVPLTGLLLALILAAALGPTLALVAPLLVGGVAAALSLATMGLVGETLSLSTTILPSLLLALGCAYAMHMVVALESALPGRHEDALSEVVQPIVISGVTTAIGFLAMATISIHAIRAVATYGALGVAVATAAALTLAPALVALRLGRDGRSKASSPTSPTDESDQPSQADQPNWRNAAGPSLATRRIRSHLLPLVESLVRRRRVAIGVAWAALIAIAVLGASRLAISTDIILWFPQGTAIRDDYERIRSELSGITPVNVMISAKTKQAPDVTAPPVLERIDRLAAALEAHPNVGKALSIADPIRMLHREFASAGDVLPEDRDLIEQYLVLLSGEARIDDVLSFDRRSANVLLRVDDNGSEEIMALGEWVTAWWERFGDSAYEVRTTGIMYEFGRAEEAIAYGQIRGLLLAAAAIGLVLLLLFRDLRTAALAMTVNLVPIGLGFGGMGLLGIPLDAATVCIGSTALGIAVDDTIHVVTGHRQGLAAGLSSREALGRALERVLPALVFTTISISAAFAVLGLSGFSLIRNLGIVTAVLVVLCLVADLTLLPALLARGERGGDPSPSSSEVGATLKG